MTRLYETRPGDERGWRQRRIKVVEDVSILFLADCGSSIGIEELGHDMHVTPLVACEASA